MGARGMLAGDPLGLAGVSLSRTVVDDPHIPDWFGLALDPYQVTGAEMIARGFRLLADEPGLGKTRQALAAAAIVGAERTVVVCPPVVVTAWCREAETSRIGVAHADGADLGCDPEGSVVAFRSSDRKEPGLPAGNGVAVVPDTLLAARPELLERFAAWAPDVVIVDEAHRCKTWTSKRARAVRRLAAGAPLAVAMSGTPMFANPVELASPLAISGHLDSVFGGWSKFVFTFARQNRWKAWVPRKKMLPELRRMLDAEVWVRRTKADVLPDLPAKVRRAKWVDVDDTAYRAANAEIVAEIDDWLDGLFERPSNDEAGEWCRAVGVGMVTRLRRAAGLAKVDAAVEVIAEHVEATTEADLDGFPVYTRPLVVWTHHREVSEAMAAAVPPRVGRAESILGGTSAGKRTELIDQFQAGEIPVLVCSIHAAGVGITLTRSSDVLFVETDWTPAVVSQAEDRVARRGQEGRVDAVGEDPHVTVLTLCAPETLDEHIQNVLADKIKVLDAVLTGADHHVDVATSATGSVPFDIIRRIVEDRVVSRWPEEAAFPLPQAGSHS